MNWYIKVLKQYADFEGRARRAEYWLFSVLSLVFTYIAVLLDYTIGTNYGLLPFGVIYTIYFLGILVPTFAVTVRRLHDVGRSGWMIFISLIPLVGSVWLLTLLAIDSDSEENKYGVSPKSLNIPIKTYKNENAVLFVIAYILFVTILYKVLELIGFYRGESLFVELFSNFISPVINLVWNIIPLILALMLNDKKKQIIGFVMGTLILYYHTSTCIYDLFKPEEFIYFQF